MKNIIVNKNGGYAAQYSKSLFVLFTLTGTLMFSSCSTFFGDNGLFRSRSKDYLKSGSIEAIEVPKGMEVASLGKLYPIPAVDVYDEFGDRLNLESYEVPPPETLGIGNKEVGVKIQKLSGRRWISLNASTSQVWPRTQKFLSDYNLPVQGSNAREGTIETGWITFRDEENARSKYLIRIEQGVHPDTTEVHVVQRQVAAGAEASFNGNWAEVRSDNDTRESWLLDELANILAESIDNNSASLLGQLVGGKDKVSFKMLEGEPVLELMVTNDRAWAIVTHALKEDGFKTWDVDRQQGLVHAGYLTPRKKPGFFRKLAFWAPVKTLPEKSKYELDKLKQHLSSRTETKKLFEDVEGVDFRQGLKDARGYLVRIANKGANTKVSQLGADTFDTSLGRGVRVFVRDARGKPLTVEQAKKLLRIIRKNLI